MEVLRENHNVARKEHQCNLCGKIIKKGEEYISQTNVNDSNIYTFKCHKVCKKIAMNFNMFQECYDEGFEEYVDDVFNEECPYIKDKEDYSTFEKVKKLNRIIES